jgi:hypothetical protein
VLAPQHPQVRLLDEPVESLLTLGKQLLQSPAQLFGVAWGQC